MSLNKEKMHFCARFLKNNGITSGIRYMQLLDMLEDDEPEFIMTRIGKKTDGFFDDLAVRLNDMWPDGEKVTERGRYRWRDTIQNTKTRLVSLWSARNLKTQDLNTVLSVARVYLSNFGEDRKYMKTLRHWILEKDIKGIYKSCLADALEAGITVPVDDIDTETGEVLEPTTGGGRLC